MNQNKHQLPKKETPWPLVRKRTIHTERLPLVGEVSANFCGWSVLRCQRNEFSLPLFSVFLIEASIISFK
jgi:hypothetical protein